MTDDLRLGVPGFGLRASPAPTAHRPGGGSVVTPRRWRTSSEESEGRRAARTVIAFST